MPGTKQSSPERVAPTPPGLVAQGTAVPENRRHLRVTLELDGGRAHVLSLRLIEKPLVQGPYALGPFIYQVSAAGHTLWVDTEADPTVERGLARPGEREHSFQASPRPMLTVRVPVTGDSVPPDLSIELFRATAAMPRDVAALAQMFAMEKVPPDLERIASLRLADLRQLPSWFKLLEESGLTEN
jgi:hypothetical protein